MASLGIKMTYVTLVDSNNKANNKNNNNKSKTQEQQQKQQQKLQQPQNNNNMKTTFLGCDSIEINLVLILYLVTTVYLA